MKTCCFRCYKALFGPIQDYVKDLCADVVTLLLDYHCIHSIPNQPLYAMFGQPTNMDIPCRLTWQTSFRSIRNFPRFSKLNRFVAIFNSFCTHFDQNENWQMKQQIKCITFWCKMWNMGEKTHLTKEAVLHYQIRFVVDLFLICPPKILMIFMGLLLFGALCDDYKDFQRVKSQKDFYLSVFESIPNFWVNTLVIAEEDYSFVMELAKKSIPWSQLEQLEKRILSYADSRLYPNQRTPPEKLAKINPRDFFKAYQLNQVWMFYNLFVTQERGVLPDHVNLQERWNQLVDGLKDQLLPYNEYQLQPAGCNKKRKRTE